MKQIPGSDDYPRVFYLYRNSNEPWLSAYDARPGDGWVADYPFVFRLRK